MLAILLWSLKLSSTESADNATLNLEVESELVPIPILPVDEIKILEVACATPVSLPTRKLPLASVLDIGVKPKSEDVAIADGTPEAPVMLPRTELAAIAERPMVAFEPPISAPAPAERVIPLLLVRVVVATDERAFVPLP